MYSFTFTYKDGSQDTDVADTEQEILECAADMAHLLAAFSYQPVEPHRCVECGEPLISESWLCSKCTYDAEEAAADRFEWHRDRQGNVYEDYEQSIGE